MDAVDAPGAAAEIKETLTSRRQREAQVRDGQTFLQAYLHDDVQAIQELKQHHVHILNEETGERMPLTHCRRPDNPKLCKADFPRTQWL